MFFAANRTDNSDIWVSTRATTSSSFGVESQPGLDPVDTLDEEYDPELVAGDTTRLYLSPQPPGMARLARATRPSAGVPFDVPVILPGLEDVAAADPTISPDERVLVFSAGATTAEVDLYFTTRVDRDAPFAIPILIPTVNDPTQYDANADLSDDGCELYFDSKRGGGSDSDIYVAAVVGS